MPCYKEGMDGNKLSLPFLLICLAVFDSWLPSLTEIMQLQTQRLQGCLEMSLQSYMQISLMFKDWWSPGN